MDEDPSRATYIDQQTGSNNTDHKGDAVEPLQEAFGHHPPPRPIGPKPLVTSILCLIGGVVVAGVQHLFYSFLNGKDVENFAIPQGWVIRIGTGFAFLFHAILVPAIAAAFAHRFWYSARQKVLSVRAIDGLFSILGNPLAFLNLELLSKTKLLCVLAGVGYLIPVASILAPVVNVPWTINTTVKVPTVANLHRDSGLVEFGTGFNYLGPSYQLIRIATRVLTTGQVLTFPSPCGPDCTYNVTFAGPAFQCRPYDSSLPLPDLSAYGPNNWVPGAYLQFDVVFFSVEVRGADTGNGLWVLYGPGPNRTTFCTFWNATYNSNVNFRNNIAEITTSVDLLSPLNATNITLYAHDLYGAPDNISSVEQQWNTLNTYTIADTVATLLQGYINVTDQFGGFATVDTMIGVASFVDISPWNMSFEGPVLNLIESLLINTTWSLTSFLTRPGLSDLGGVNITQPANYTSVPAIVTSYPGQYVYSHFPLWGAYGIALALVGICAIIGGVMLLRNGMDGGLNFSDVLMTTRNPTLDKVCLGTELAGCEMVTNKLKNIRLRYGVLPGDGPRMAFGTEDEILPIKGRK